MQLKTKIQRKARYAVYKRDLLPDNYQYVSTREVTKLCFKISTNTQQKQGTICNIR